MSVINNRNYITVEINRPSSVVSKKLTAGFDSSPFNTPHQNKEATKGSYETVENS